MTKFLKYYIVICFCVFVAQLAAQDALFSQLHNSRNLLNPALLSLQNSPLEVDLNYREQGGSISTSLPIRTFQVLANYSRTTFKVDQMSYGLSILSDRGGDGHIGGSLAHGHFAYLKKLSGRYSKIGAHYLGLGVLAGGGQRSVDANSFWFGNQFNEEFNFIEKSRDPRESALQNGTLRSPIFYNIDAGLTWYSEISDAFSMHGGFGLFHINSSNVALIEGQVERQKVRYSAHFGTANRLSDLLLLLPKIQFFRQGSSSSLILGTELSTNNGDQNEFVFKFGGFIRGNSGINGAALDALIATVNLSYSQFDFGLGYDITISKLAKYNSSRGGWELRLAYKFLEKKKANSASQYLNFQI